MAQSNVTLVRPDGTEPSRELQVDAEEFDFDVGFDLPAPKQQAPPAPRGPPPVARPPPPMMRPPPQQQQPQLRAEDLNDFANPNKIEDSPEPEEYEDDEPQYEEQYEEDYEEEPQYYQQQQQPQIPQIQPLPPFETLEDERADLMYKLQRASRSGVSVRTFGWNADIREMRAEATRVKAEQEVDASIAFQRQILMTMCTGLEFANKKFAYLDLELDGWSESMMDDLGKFDTVFEKLHKKHAGRMNIPPELQLIFMIGGSAMTWHLVASSRKRSTINEKKKKRVRQVSSSESESSSEDDSDTESERSKLRRRYAKPAKKPKKEMRGPGFDVGGMMGGLGGLGGMGGLGGLASSMLPQPPVPHRAPQATRRPPKQKQIEEFVSDVSEDDASQEDDDVSEESERLSDIPSEDLEDVPSEDLDSPEEEEEENDEKVINFEEPPKKRRGRQPKKADPKTVVVI